MTEREHLKYQEAQLRRLIDESAGSFILVTQLRERLKGVENELRLLDSSSGNLFPNEIELPRVALFLKGNGVAGDTGIRPALAGEALIQYERMFIEQALHNERAAARSTGRSRRRRGSPMPSLLFTGTPRGSFGLEFVPQGEADDPALPVHAQALHHIANALEQVTSSDPTLETAIHGISPRVLPPMKKFLKTLASYDAELRLAFSDQPSKTINAERIKQASERLEREWKEEQTERLGTFRGLTRETTIFDLIDDEGTLITGSVADDLTEEDFDRISALTNQRCVAYLEKTTLRSVGGGAARVNYILLDAKPLDAPSSGVTEPVAN